MFEPRNIFDSFAIAEAMGILEDEENLADNDVGNVKFWAGLMRNGNSQILNLYSLVMPMVTIASLKPLIGFHGVMKNLIMLQKWSERGVWTRKSRL